jgi:hypothetical protein
MNRYLLIKRLKNKIITFFSVVKINALSFFCIQLLWPEYGGYLLKRYQKKIVSQTLPKIQEMVVLFQEDNFFGSNILINS